MKAEEYDAFLYDPSDFVLRTYLPRACGARQPLQQLPYLGALFYTRALTGTAAFGAPEVAGAPRRIRLHRIKWVQRFDAVALDSNQEAR